MTTTVKKMWIAMPLIKKCCVVVVGGIATYGAIKIGIEVIKAKQANNNFNKS